MPMQKWRFINSGCLSGPENMAIDEALLQAFDPEHSQPVFRLYGWSPPALSLGRFQKAAELLNLGRCHAASLPVVRRITGGGIIYHADELTYSIVCSPSLIPPTFSSRDVYRILTAFLLYFYRKLGLEAVYVVDRSETGESQEQQSSLCFAGRENFDILLGGRKIGGNAQRRLKRVIFQHGSIPLSGCATLGLQFLLQPPSGLEARCTCLEAEVDFSVRDKTQLGSALQAAFCHSLGAELVEAALTRSEQQLVNFLLNEKYLNDGWNLRGEAG